MSRRQVMRGLAALGAAIGLSGCAPGTARTPERDAGVPAPIHIGYGEHPSQFGQLHLPSGERTCPVVVVLHGGFWAQRYGLDLGTPLAADLANRGVAAWNLEYRRLGGGGGWPGTFIDVARGVDALRTMAGEHRLDLDHVVTLGHSAGGQLAVWAAGRHRLPAEAPGADPDVRPVGAVSQAGVLDLVRAARDGLGGMAVPSLLGGVPDTVPERYSWASPTELVPIGVPVSCVHGTSDTIVPISQSESYKQAADRAGDRAEVIRVPGGHLEQIDPSTPAWAATRDAVLADGRRGHGR
ncbi:MAG: prolyl oligopeptidase family serine peptidase [Sciscionella sp.]